MSTNKYLSTTALSKHYGMQTRELFSQLEKMGLISRNGESWELTESGKKKGGTYKVHKDHGQYIAWPENIDINIAVNEALITSTAIGKHFGVSAIKTNHILSELGWIKKSLKGWMVTDQGAKQGGIQDEDKKSGVPFARWPETIINTKALIETIEQVKGTKEETTTQEIVETKEIGFRDKFEAKHRATDGHFVRSKAETLIDNWLYMAGIVHAYERKLPIEEEAYSDFYIPTGNVYIEYWGYDNDEKYLNRKKQKIEIYKKYDFNLIELVDKDVQNLDDVLPRLLLKFGVQAY
jgi:hypothetical protein